MNISPEVILWIIGGLVHIVSVNIHLLIRIFSNVSAIRTEMALVKQRQNFTQKETVTP